jgi:hypothetical protein
VQKKVVQQPDGSWFCESTGACYPTCEYRYIASMKIGDHTDSTWCTGFNDVAVKLLGKTADEMHNLKEENEEVREIMNECSCLLPDSFVDRIEVSIEWLLLCLLVTSTLSIAT